MTTNRTTGRSGAEGRLRVEGGPRVSRTTVQRIGHVLVTAQMVLIVACVLPLGPVVQLADPVQAIGAVLLALAGVIGIAALLSMGRRTRVHPVPAPDAVLHTHGIYAFVRHPMYLAVGLGCAGAVASSGRVLGLVALPLLLVVLAVKANFEDRLLDRAFGWQFAVYASRVPAVIPQPWRSHGH